MSSVVLVTTSTWRAVSCTMFKPTGFVSSLCSLVVLTSAVDIMSHMLNAMAPFCEAAQRATAAKCWEVLAQWCDGPGHSSAPQCEEELGAHHLGRGVRRSPSRAVRSATASPWRWISPLTQSTSRSEASNRAKMCPCLRFRKHAWRRFSLCHTSASLNESWSGRGRKHQDGRDHCPDADL